MKATTLDNILGFIVAIVTGALFSWLCFGAIINY